jgi:tetratricopeptide (TPR) repeat protein
MSMDSSQAAQFRDRSQRGWRPLRQLWQVPTFCAGLLALVVVGSTHPLWSGRQAYDVERRLALAGQALDRPQPDLDQAIAQAQQALADAAAPQQLALAHFLLGTAYLRRAEAVSPQSAAVCWELALEHLQRAEQLGVAEPETARLCFGLGKAYFHLGREPERVVELLRRSIRDGKDDLFEKHGLLAQAYLRLPNPDLRSARETLEKQLALPTVEEEALAGPRLLLADIYRRLDQLDEARKVLARIGPEAPPELLFHARYLLARTLQEEGLWGEAAVTWELVKADPRAANVGLGRVCYALGLCYRRIEQPALAERAWQEARKHGGEEAQAADMGLAELHFRAGRPVAAVEALDSALRTVASPADYRNSLVDLTAARQLCEGGIRWCLQRDNHEVALSLGRLYEKLALPGVAGQLTGQAAEAAAGALQEQAKAAASAELARPLEAKARDRYRQAGEAFEQAAGLLADPAEQADWLWRSAQNYLAGQAQMRALPVLQRFLALPVSPRRLGEGWYLRGEAFQSLGNHVAAQADFRHCIKFPSPFAYRARYQLAMYQLESKDYAEAEETLRQNLQLMETDSEKETVAHEKTLYALAHLLFDQRNYRPAFDLLEKALESYPDNPNSPAARFRLGQAAMHLADQAGQKINEAKDPAARTHWRLERQRWLETAAAHFGRLSADCANRSLSPDEERMARQAAFAVAGCRFDLGQFDEALRLYEELARRHRNQVEELIALRHVWQCHGVKFQPDHARRTLDAVREALRQLPDSAFDNTADLRTRRWWEEWLREKTRQAP